MVGKDQQTSFSSKCKRFFALFGIVLFLLTYAPEIVESRRSFGGSRSFGRSYSRSSSRSYSRSSTSRTYSKPKSSSSSSRSTYTKPSTSTSSRSSYGSSRTTGTTPTRGSATARQRQTATNRAKTTNTPSTRNSTTSRTQQRTTTAQNRKQVRQLTAENRSLKRKVTTANRQTASARRQQRQTITVNNFGGYYPMVGYSIYSRSASIAYNNMLFGIYFHDHYNHRIRHSYLWHYHHRDYDRSHWSKEKQEEYEFYKDYYESQGVEANSSYVDPGTDRDENYIASYVDENPDKFYGENIETVTVEELPDEKAIKQELLASAESPNVTTNTQRAPPQQHTVIVQKKTSGATWFVLIFGALLVVGVIMLVMYNKGYF